MRTIFNRTTDTAYISVWEFTDGSLLVVVRNKTGHSAWASEARGVYGYWGADPDPVAAAIAAQFL